MDHELSRTMYYGGRLDQVVTLESLDDMQINGEAELFQNPNVPAPLTRNPKSALVGEDGR
jgi:hypothetical protein